MKDAEKRHIKRKEDRLPWSQSPVTLSVQHPGGHIADIKATARNLSALGVGVVVPMFLHTGSNVSIVLAKHDRSREERSGTIRWCVYEGGKHFAGVKFDEKLDLSEYIPPADYVAKTDDISNERIKGTCLQLMDSPLSRSVLEAALQPCPCELNAVEHTGAMLDALKANPADIIVAPIEFDQQTFSECTALARDTGFFGPAILIASTEEDVIAAKCGANQPAGISQWPASPESIRTTLSKAIAQWAGTDDDAPPISRLDDGSEAMQAILTKYISACSGVADQLQIAMRRRDQNKLREILSTVSLSSSSLGYDTLNAASREAVLLLDQADDWERISRCVARAKQILTSLTLKAA